MTSPRDQFSAVSKAQFEAQFDFFNSMTTQALDSAGRLAALNLAVSRDSVQRSLGLSVALLNSRDPRDILSLGGKAEEGFHSLFSYGRELLGIASGVRPYPVRPQALGQAQAIETVEVIERSAAIEAAPAAEAAHAVSAIAPVSQPIVVAEPAPAQEAETLANVAEPVPVAEPKAIAKAVGKGAAQAAAAPHPAAAPLAAAGDEVKVPKVDTPPASSRRRK